MAMNKDMRVVMRAYEAYGETTNFKNYQGLPMPKWEDLTVAIQNAWTAAVESVRPIPCPHGTPDTHCCMDCSGSVAKSLTFNAKRIGELEAEVGKLNYAIMDRDTRPDFERGERYGEEQMLVHMMKPDILKGNSLLSATLKGLHDKWIKEHDAQR